MYSVPILPAEFGVIATASSAHAAGLSEACYQIVPRTLRRPVSLLIQRASHFVYNSNQLRKSAARTKMAVKEQSKLRHQPQAGVRQKGDASMHALQAC